MLHLPTTALQVTDGLVVVGHNAIDDPGLQKHATDFVQTVLDNPDLHRTGGDALRGIMWNALPWTGGGRSKPAEDDADAKTKAKSTAAAGASAAGASAITDTATGPVPDKTKAPGKASAKAKTTPKATPKTTASGANKGAASPVVVVPSAAPQVQASSNEATTQAAPVQVAAQNKTVQASVGHATGLAAEEGAPTPREHNGKPVPAVSRGGDADASASAWREAPVSLAPVHANAEEVVSANA